MPPLAHIVCPWWEAVTSNLAFDHLPLTSFKVFSMSHESNILKLFRLMRENIEFYLVKELPAFE